MYPSHIMYNIQCTCTSVKNISKKCEVIPKTLETRCDQRVTTTYNYQVLSINVLSAMDNKLNITRHHDPYM